ncbi:MAG: transcriptional regulator [Bdellovibrio sp.]|nr:MAG: transcriptional regulator [Bdellovibrio sp.]
MDKKSLAELVRFRRKQAGLSQLQLAELAGVGKTLVFNVEKGNINVHFENLLSVLRVLNIKLRAEVVYPRNKLKKKPNES